MHTKLVLSNGMATVRQWNYYFENKFSMIKTNELCEHNKIDKKDNSGSLKISFMINMEILLIIGKGKLSLSLNFPFLGVKHTKFGLNRLLS